MASNEKEGSITCIEGTRAATEANSNSIAHEDEQGVGRSLSTMRIALVLLSLYGISAASSLGTGLVMIGIPQIAQKLSLQNGLLLWPGSAYSLTSGCCFLLSGKLADLVGTRTIGLSGCLVMTISLAVTGVSQTGVQFIVFCALQGLGAAMFLPTNISIWTSAVPKGRLRNFGFACLSFSSPVGLQTGYLLAGVFGEPGRSWRWGFWLCAGIMALLLVLGFIAFPMEGRRDTVTWKSALRDLDLIGMLISIVVLGFLGFALAELSDSVSKIRSPQVISSLIITVVSGVAFVYWMNMRQHQGLSPLVPNSLWRNSRFNIICILLVLCWATSNSIEWFFSLFFQEIQGISGLQAAIRLIPNVLIGLFTGMFTGYLVHRLPINIFVTSACLITTAAPLIMALISPTWSYWIAAFWALIVAPTAQDVIYTVSNIIITETMPKSQHGLAGGVFNALGGLGTSIGIAILAIVSNSTIQTHSEEIKIRSVLLMSGYRAAFWTSFGMSVAMTVMGAIGLRNVWRIGKA